jgi:hypothetical protein
VTKTHEGGVCIERGKPLYAEITSHHTPRNVQEQEKMQEQDAKQTEVCDVYITHLKVIQKIYTENIHNVWCSHRLLEESFCEV